MEDINSQKIYKYQPFNLYSLVNLIKRELYFSKPENLNDPYDCNPPFEITKTHRTQNNIKALFEKVRLFEIGKSGIDGSKFDQTYLTNGEPNKRFERDFIDSPKPIREQITSKVGVTCFSKLVDNFLLWSHYTDKHQGFCLEFDTTILLRNFPGAKLYDVTYPRSNKPIRFSILDILNNPELMAVKLLTSKSYSWNYEKEKRIICTTEANATFQYSETAITGVYYGHNMPEEHKDVIASVLSAKSKQITVPGLLTMGNNYPYVQILGTQINAYNMGLSHNKFELKPEHFRPRIKKR